MSDLSFLDLPHAGHAHGVVALPGSKSISNRVLLLAALAEGSTEITGLLDSDDTRVMLAALRALGVGVAVHGDGRATVAGAGRFPVPRAELFLGNAGTAVRPLTAALALMGGDYSIAGVPRMHERPIGDLVQALRALGAHIDYTGQEGFPPLRIGQASLRSGHPVQMPGSVSSQFLTALLLAAPIHTAQSGVPMVIEIVGELISKPYIEITLNLMARYGVTVGREGWSRFVVPADAVYRSPGRIAVEGDASSASYFLALGAIGGGPVRVTGVGKDSIQGDIAFARTLESMGATVTGGPDWIEVRGVQVARGEKLRAFDADFNLIPDAAMTAAALALFADGPCRLRNIGSWRVKETDRIHAMQTELGKLGAGVESGPDWLRVTPPAPGGWRDAHIGTWDDHRMAMSMSVAAFGPAAVRILDPGCVSKTFPTYFDVYAALVGDQESHGAH
jgi:3-phosphoshikimate 1-carboxyvinyltransferase